MPQLIRTHCLTASILTLALQGCGGGGGSNDSNPDASITYNGITTQAAISADNADELTTTSLGGAESSSASGLVGVETASQAGAPVSLTLSKQLISIAANTATEGGSTLLPGTTQSSTEDCSGGGQISVTIDVNDNTGAFNADLTASNCQEEGTTLNGDLSFSGTLDTSSDDFDGPITISFDDLNVQTEESGGVDTTANGNMSCSISLYASDMDCTLNMDTRDNISGDTYRYEDYRLVETSAGASISGRVYHPDYGYVDITTNSLLMFSDSTGWPYSGELELSGENNSSAIITALNSSEYSITIDADGNGNYDPTEIHNWP